MKRELNAEPAPFVAQAFQPAGLRDFPVPCPKSMFIREAPEAPASRWQARQALAAPKPREREPAKSHQKKPPLSAPLRLRVKFSPSRPVYIRVHPQMRELNAEP